MGCGGLNEGGAEIKRGRAERREGDKEVSQQNVW